MTIVQDAEVDQRRRRVGIVVAVVGAALLLVELPLLLASGLVVPPVWVGVFFVVWLVGVGVGVWQLRSRPWLMLLIPSAVALIWFVTVTIGGAVAGWHA